jgi:uncharacterized protein (DUF433 family)
MVLRSRPAPGVTRVAREPTVQFGAPTVGGSRTTVAAIVLAAREGLGADAILYEFPHLTAHDVADALAYYVQHREEVDQLADAYARGGE